MMFNVNNYVRIKLTDYGKEILRKRFDEMHEKFPKAFKKFRTPKEDADGWSKWQMWDLMNTFGDYVSLGMEVPFDTVIEILE